MMTLSVDDLIEMFGLEWGDYVEYLEDGTQIDLLSTAKKVIEDE